MDDLVRYAGGQNAEFLAWLRRVDAQIGELVGLRLLDLPDMDYFGMFDSEVSSSEAALMALDNAGYSDEEDGE